MLFDNSVTFGLFIRVFVHLLLYSTGKHKCSNFDINLNEKKYTTKQLIAITIKAYIDMLRIHCTNFLIYLDFISVSDIAHLLILNTDDQLSLVIDMNVYSKDQQFRLFDCGKKEQMRSLVYCNLSAFNKRNDMSSTDLLRKSIITNIGLMNIPIIYIKNNDTDMNKISSSPVVFNKNIDLTNFNIRWNCFYSMNARSISNSYFEYSNIESFIKQINDHYDGQVKEFNGFVTGGP